MFSYLKSLSAAIQLIGIVALIVIGLFFFGLKKCSDGKVFKEEVKKNEQIQEKRQEKAKQEAGYFIKQQKKEKKSVKEAEKAFKKALPQPKKVLKKGAEAVKKEVGDIKETWEEKVKSATTPEQLRELRDESFEEFGQGLKEKFKGKKK